MMERAKVYDDVEDVVPCEKEPTIDAYLALIYEHAMDQNAIEQTVSVEPMALIEPMQNEPEVDTQLALI